MTCGFNGLTCKKIYRKLLTRRGALIGHMVKRPKYSIIR